METKKRNIKQIKIRVLEIHYYKFFKNWSCRLNRTSDLVASSNYLNKKLPIVDLK